MGELSLSCLFLPVFKHIPCQCFAPESYYVEEAFENEEIRNYIAELRRDLDDEELYIGFENWEKKNLPTF